MILAPASNPRCMSLLVVLVVRACRAADHSPRPERCCHIRQPPMSPQPPQPPVGAPAHWPQQPGTSSQRHTQWAVAGGGVVISQVCGGGEEGGFSCAAHNKKNLTTIVLKFHYSVRGYSIPSVILTLPIVFPEPRRQ